MDNTECKHLACECVASRLEKAETDREALANIIMERAKEDYESMQKVSHLINDTNVPDSWQDCVPPSLFLIFDDNGIKPLE